MKSAKTVKRLIGLLAISMASVCWGNTVPPVTFRGQATAATVTLLGINTVLGDTGVLGSKGGALEIVGRNYLRIQAKLAAFRKRARLEQPDDMLPPPAAQGLACDLATRGPASRQDAHSNSHDYFTDETTCFQNSNMAAGPPLVHQGVSHQNHQGIPD